MSTQTNKLKLTFKLAPFVPQLIAALAVIFLNALLPWIVSLGIIFVAYIYLKRTFGPELAMETATTALMTLAFLKLSGLIMPLLFITLIVGLVYFVIKKLASTN